MFSTDGIYKVREIKPILSNYHKLPTEVRVDVDKALHSELIDGSMYLFCALHYEHGFSLMTTGKYMGLNLKEIMELNEEFLERIEAHMNGYRAKARPKPTSIPPIGWSELLLGQYISPFDVDYFDDELLKRDVLGREVLVQRKHGMPAHIKAQLFGTEYSEEVYSTRPVNENADGFELDAFLVDDRKNNGVRRLHEGE